METYKIHLELVSILLVNMKRKQYKNQNYIKLWYLMSVLDVQILNNYNTNISYYSCWLLVLPLSKVSTLEEGNTKGASTGGTS